MIDSNLKKRLFLGIDLGTTNIKAIVADFNGRILAESSTTVRLEYPAPDAVVQDIDEIYRSVLQVCHGALKQISSPGDVESIGVSGQGGALQVLDRNRDPVGKVISWLDQRGSDFNRQLDEIRGPEWIARRTGRRRSGLAIGQLLRIREENPQWLQEPHHIGFVGDVIVSRLCGRAACDATSLGLTLLYNPYMKDYDPDLLRLIGLKKEQLPDLISPRESAGGLVSHVASELGLKSGIPVGGAIHDQYAAALGVGATRSGDIMFGSGTAWVLLAVTDHPVRTITRDAFFCDHVVPELYGQIVSLTNGGSAFAWSLKLLGLEHKSQKEIDAIISSVPAGGNGLRFWPFLASFDAFGIKPGTRGRLNGLQLYHGSADVLRAVVEGLACELSRFLNFFREADIVSDRLIMCGKAGSSLITPQIIADVTRLPVACANHVSASALGASVLARGIVESDVTLESISEQMISVSRQIDPGPDTEIYGPIQRQYLDSLIS